MYTDYSCAATDEKSIPSSPEIPPPKRCAHENRGEKKKELKKWKKQKNDDCKYSQNCSKKEK